jgi:hypothetical protein
MTRCAECDFDWDAAPDVVIAIVASAGARFSDAIAPFDDARVRARPAPDVWSPLEYTAHTREGIRFYDERITRVLTEDRPHFVPFDVDEAAERDAYNAEVVAYALEHLAAIADRMSGRLRDLAPADWERAGIGSAGGDGGERTVLVLARRAAHEVVHHLMDVARQR